MKHFYLIIIALFCFAQSFAQDPELFRTWYLYEFQESDLGTLYIIQNINPPINPYITISETLEFNGEGACNTFDGVFEHLGTINLEVIVFNNTTDICGNPTHIIVENSFFDFMRGGYWYEITNEADGFTLILSTPIFGYALFKEFPLSANDYIFEDEIQLYPNPASEILYVNSETVTIGAFSIYDVTGQEILKRPNLDNSIDVSILSEGIYFLEIRSNEGRIIKRFIKK